MRQIKSNLVAYVSWAALLSTLLVGCLTSGSKDNHSVYLPFIKNTANECYYLDEFMPVPDSMVRGKTGSIDLRYYSYNFANYKDWQDRHIILSFYSQNGDCWSLFEEYYVKE